MSDNISRSDAICEVLVNDGIDNIVGRINALPSTDAVSRDVYDKRTQADEEIIDSYRQEFQKALSAEAVDCTDFIEWLVDRVLDETIWENNSVAYGEIICRKLVKLGVLEVTEEPSYYIRPSAEAVTIHEDGTLEVKVPNAHKVGRVLVIDTESHIGGGLFYPDDAVQGKWIFNPTDAIDLMFAKPKCSKCGFESSDGGNYCPNCGTWMHGKVAWK